MGDDLVVAGGALYQLIPNTGWVPVSGSPVAPTSIQWAFSPSRDDLIGVVDMADNGWARDGVGAAWINYGPAPGGATPALKQTWGELKGRYR